MNHLLETPIGQPQPPDEIPKGFEEFKMLRRLQIAILTAILFIGFYGLSLGWKVFWRITCVGVLAAGAFLSVGVLLGFIFAIPRKPVRSGNKKDSESEDFDKDNDFEFNSNLGDISDWLTKIVVGVGLVELNKLPQGMKALASYIGSGLRDCGDVTCIHSSESLALGITIFFFAVGFMIGYIWTTLYFKRALSNAFKKLRDQRAATWAASRSQIMTDLKDFDRANELADTALSREPNNLMALINKGRVLKRMALREDEPRRSTLLKQALEYVSRAASLYPDQGAPVYNMACYQALLGENRSEVLKNLRRAIEINPELKKNAGTDEDLLASLRHDPDFKKLTGLE